MSAEIKKDRRIEPQPLNPIGMPDYHYQIPERSERQTSGTQDESKRVSKPVDLRGVSLNFS